MKWGAVSHEGPASGVTRGPLFLSSLFGVPESGRADARRDPGGDGGDRGA